MYVKIHEIARIAEGYEYFYSVFDNDGNVVIANQFAFAGKHMPDETEIDNWKTQALKEIENAQTEESTEPEIEEVTVVEDSLIQEKRAIKNEAIGVIKQTENPAMDDVVNALSKKHDPDFVRFLLKTYVQMDYQKGFIKQPSWEEFVNDIKTHTVEELEARK